MTTPSPDTRIAEKDSERLVWLEAHDADFGRTTHFTFYEATGELAELSTRFVRVPCKHLYEWHCYDGGSWREAIDNAMAAPECVGEDGECANSHSIRDTGAAHAREERNEVATLKRIARAVEAEREACAEVIERMAPNEGYAAACAREFVAAIRARGVKP